MKHEGLDADALATRDVYRLMTDLVAPRPIAWISTLSTSGGLNLAPYSYFQAISSNPPTVVVGMGWRSDGRPKDTLRNVLDTREFTVSHVSEALVEPMNASSADYEPEDDEAAALGVEMAPSTRVAPPRVAAALASLECRMEQAIPLGWNRRGNSPSTTLVIARVVHFSVAEGLIRRNEAGHLHSIPAAELEAVGRLGGIGYTSTSGRFELARPSAPERKS